MSYKGLLAFLFIVVPPVVFNAGCAPGWYFMSYPVMYINYWLNAVTWLIWQERFGVSEKCLPLSFTCTDSPFAFYDNCAWKYKLLETPSIWHYASAIYVLIFVLIVIRLIYDHIKEENRIDSMKSKHSLA